MDNEKPHNKVLTYTITFISLIVAVICVLRLIDMFNDVIKWNKNFSDWAKFIGITLLVPLAVALKRLWFGVIPSKRIWIFLITLAMLGVISVFIGLMTVNSAGVGL
jgi:hypothetical protein